MNVTRTIPVQLRVAAIVLLLHGRVNAQVRDTTPTLSPVTIKAAAYRNNFAGATPAQSLNAVLLRRLNLQTVGDAARYFSGVLIRDYGGVGGLKTISVRSLGATHTGIVYDGLPVSDAQTGQVDLARYSPLFLESLDLFQSGVPSYLVPARVNAGASTLVINSWNNSFRADRKQSLRAGISTGSFGYVQAHAGLYQPLAKRTAMSLTTQALYVDGDYPFTVENGLLSERSRRTNSRTRSEQTELNFAHLFTDSSSLQLKLSGALADRGLPGAIVFFTNHSVQRLQNADLFAQARYQKQLGARSNLLLGAKYTYSFVRYTDPDFLNNQGGLDNRYNQREWYGTVAMDHSFSPAWVASVASDLAINSLDGNGSNFAEPERSTLWNNFSLHYTRERLRVTGSILYTHVRDRARRGPAAGDEDQWAPAISGSYKPSENSPFLFRASYKASFRMPGFNDLYYSFIGNTALKPEYARQYNAGLSYMKPSRQGYVNAELDFYFNQVRDKIIAVPGQNLFVWTMLNLGRVRTSGVDLTIEGGGHFNTKTSWYARTAYTLQRSIDVTGPANTSYKNRIPYTPDHSGSMIFSMSRQQWEAGYNLLFSGTRYALGVNDPSNKLPGWITQDIFLARAFFINPNKLTIRAELNNLFDARYAVVRYYPMQGRSFKLSLLFNHI